MTLSRKYMQGLLVPWYMLGVLVLTWSGMEVHRRILAHRPLPDLPLHAAAAACTEAGGEARGYRLQRHRGVVRPLSVPGTVGMPAPLPAAPALVEVVLEDAPHAGIVLLSHADMPTDAAALEFCAVDFGPTLFWPVSHYFRGEPVHLNAPRQGYRHLQRLDLTPRRPWSFLDTLLPG